MTIHISGSLAYDRIMTFPGHFEEHLLPEKLHILNVCFVIDRIEEKRGGTAGNIAYNLFLLGEKPRLYSTVGRDFATYFAALQAMGLPMEGIRQLEESLTASCYITTDRKGNQITGFSPAAMGTPADPAFYPRPEPGDWGIVAPGNMEDMRILSELFRSKDTPYIFDPGQQVPVFTPEGLLNGFTGAAILIGNDYEMELIREMTHLSKADLLTRVGYMITTMGDAGSEIMCKEWDKPRYIAAFKGNTVLDPTGAGDAYRAGLLKGLHSGLDVETSAEMGTICASFCIEKYGTQEHTFTPEMFKQRFEHAFGTFPELCC